MEPEFTPVFISDEMIRTIRMLQTGDEENTKPVEKIKCTNNGIGSIVASLGEVRDFLIDLSEEHTCIDSDTLLNHLCFIRNTIAVIDSFRVTLDSEPYSILK